MKSVRVRSFSGPHFLALKLNTEIYSVCLRIQSEFGKMRTRNTPNTGIFYAVMTKNKIGKGYQTDLSDNGSESEIDMNSSDDEEQIHGKSRGNKNIAQEIRS